jgi:hypothetical protein
MFNELEAIIGVVAGTMSTQQHGIEIRNMSRTLY